MFFFIIGLILVLVIEIWKCLILLLYGLFIVVGFWIFVFKLVFKFKVNWEGLFLLFVVFFCFKVNVLLNVIFFILIIVLVFCGYGIMFFLKFWRYL